MRRTENRCDSGAVTRRAAVLSAAAALTMVLGTACPLAAQEMSFAEIEAAAKEEGRLVIYTSSVDAEMQFVVEAFMEDYPEIDTEWIRLPSTTLFSRFVSELEADAVQSDLLHSGSTALYRLRPELFRELNATNLPNLGENPTIPAANSHYIVTEVQPHVITYNTNMVSEEDVKEHLKTWQNLTDERWRGKIAMVDPSLSTNVTSWIMMLRDTYGEEWVRKLAAHDLNLIGAGSAGAQQVGAGQFELVVPTVLIHSAGIRAQGAPVATITPDGPAHALEQGMAVPLKSNHPNAAIVFANWRLGEKGQKLVCQFGNVAVRPVVPDDCPKLSPNHLGSADDMSPELQREMSELIGHTK